MKIVRKKTYFLSVFSLTMFTWFIQPTIEYNTANDKWCRFPLYLESSVECN